MSNEREVEARKVYERVAGALEVEGAVRSVMFGMPSLTVNSTAIGGYTPGEMVFKLQGDEHTRALALPGARLFDPSGRGGPMKAWVQVPYEHHREWLDLAIAAARCASP